MEIRNIRTYEGGFVIEWKKDGAGFGELTFNNNENGGIIDSEHMGEEFCKEVFEAFIKKCLPEKFKKQTNY